MAVAFRAAGALAQSTDPAATAVPYPAGVAAGDLLILQYITTPTGTTPTPSGWTKLFGPTTTTTYGNKCYVFWKIAGSSEPSTVSVVPGGGANGAGIMSAFTGANATTPIDVHAEATIPGGGTSATMTTPSVTTTVANTMLLRIYWAHDGTAVTPPGSDTERYDANANLQPCAMEAATSIQAAAGASGTTTATLNSNKWGGLGSTIALAPGSTVTPPPSDPPGVSVAFGDNWDVPNPTWTRIDNVAGRRVRGYTIDRGRPNEFEKTGTGTATIRIADTIGTFDPTDPAEISNVAPGRQANISLWNPTNSTWHTIFRGYVESWRYVLDQTRQLLEIELTLTDGFAILSRYELRPLIDGAIPGPPPYTSPPYANAAEAAQQKKLAELAKGNVLYGETVAVTGQPTSGTVGDRILSILGDAGWPYDLATNWIGFPPGTIPDIFSGNVRVGPKAYAAGTSALDALWDAADAEIPGVANLFMARDGHIRFRGRQARFRPDVAQYGIVHRNAGDPSAMTSIYHGPPMFSDEGPAFYDAAYAHNAPFSQGSPYKTTLTGPQETAFRDWVVGYEVPFDPDEDPTDYDMRGFYKASVIDNTIPDWTGPGSHFPDTYKTPYDTTFSKQSQYATATCPFDWVVDPLWGDLLIDFRDNSIVFGPPNAAYVVPIAELEFSHGEDNLYNSCTATPQGINDAGELKGPADWRPYNPDPPDNDDPTTQTATAPTSIAAHGLRGLTFDNLQTLEGKATGNNSMVETALFAAYYVQNYADPHPRISRLVFKTRAPTAQNAGALWELLCNAEISDLLSVVTNHPGAGGFAADFFVEGLHYQVTPGPPEHAVVELSLDVSPRAHWTTNPFDTDTDPAL